jgi:hypothetical protein
MEIRNEVISRGRLDITWRTHVRLRLSNKYCKLGHDASTRAHLLLSSVMRWLKRYSHDSPTFLPSETMPLTTTQKVDSLLKRFHDFVSRLSVPHKTQIAGDLSVQCSGCRCRGCESLDAPAAEGTAFFNVPERARE